MEPRIDLEVLKTRKISYPYRDSRLGLSNPFPNQDTDYGVSAHSTSLRPTEVLTSDSTCITCPPHHVKMRKVYATTLRIYKFFYVHVT